MDRQNLLLKQSLVPAIFSFMSEQKSCEILVLFFSLDSSLALCVLGMLMKSINKPAIYK